MSSQDAKRQWIHSNNIEEVENLNKLFRYSAEENKRQCDARPWRQDVHHFKNVKISAIALIKMVTHARSGGTIEVMGLMQGKIDGDTMIVIDAFALPVEGTETRVNAASEANEYMVQYNAKSKEVGRMENIIGWYHSHPGYGCWLSGIDVSTQLQNQQFMEPFLAVVIDPIRTISSGKVEIGAFRTYPADWIPPEGEDRSEYQSIPLDKIDDFGVHWKKYYSLEISYFKSSLDSFLLDKLWSKYWKNTLASSPLISSYGHSTKQIADLAEKLKRSASATSYGKSDTEKLKKLSHDAGKVTHELCCAWMHETMKNVLFTPMTKDNADATLIETIVTLESMTES